MPSSSEISHSSVAHGLETLLRHVQELGIRSRTAGWVAGSSVDESVLSTHSTHQKGIVVGDSRICDIPSPLPGAFTSSQDEGPTSARSENAASSLMLALDSTVSSLRDTMTAVQKVIVFRCDLMVRSTNQYSSWAVSTRQLFCTAR
jgi:hypothetical protein